MRCWGASAWSWAILLIAIFLAAWFAIGWVAFSAACDFSKHPQPTETCKVLKVLFDWQNAYGGIAAVVAAFIGGRYILRQIAEARTAAEELRLREERAARAVLPLALSQLSQYARDCIRMLEPLTVNNAAVPADLEAPRIPENTVLSLQVCARHADAFNADKIAKALGKLQINHSRLQSWVQRLREDGHARTQQGLEYMWGAADLHAAIADLFRYGRDEDLVRQRATVDEVTSALHNAGVWDDSHPIWELVDRRAAP